MISLNRTRLFSLSDIYPIASSSWGARVNCLSFCSKRVCRAFELHNMSQMCLMMDLSLFLLGSSLRIFLHQDGKEKMPYYDNMKMCRPIPTSTFTCVQEKKLVNQNLPYHSNKFRLNVVNTNYVHTAALLQQQSNMLL